MGHWGVFWRRAAIRLMRRLEIRPVELASRVAGGRPVRSLDRSGDGFCDLEAILLNEMPPTLEGCRL